MEQGAQYPDPTAVASDVYHLVLENDRVRVFDVRFKPGQKAVMHRHPDHVIYALTKGTNRLVLPGGQTMDAELKPGMTIFSQYYWSCPELHMGWALVEARDEQDAQASIPSQFRNSARIIRAESMSLEKLRAAHSNL